MRVKHRVQTLAGSPADRLAAARLALADAERRTSTEPAKLLGPCRPLPGRAGGKPARRPGFSAKRIPTSVSTYCEDPR
jgi:hypothetical protein